MGELAVNPDPGVVIHVPRYRNGALVASRFVRCAQRRPADAPFRLNEPIDEFEQRNPIRRVTSEEQSGPDGALKHQDWSSFINSNSRREIGTNLEKF